MLFCYCFRERARSCNKNFSVSEENICLREALKLEASQAKFEAIIMKCNKIGVFLLFCS